jgi:hypothetical protein
MPTPKKGESKKDYVSRCIPIVLEEGTAKDQQQAAAICYSMYDQHKEKEEADAMTTNEKDSLLNMRTGDTFMRGGKQPGVLPGKYPEIDTSEPLPRSLQPRQNRVDEIDGLTEIKQP